MSRRRSVFLAAYPVAIASLFLVPHSAAGQTAATPLKTSWGDPNLQGIWTFRTITPLERPEELADKAELTAEEAAAYELE